MKTIYETPTVADLGTFETITQGTQLGENLDADFPTNTPRGELTFS